MATPPVTTPVVEEVFEAADLESAEQALSAGYARLRIEGRGQRGGVRVTQARLSPAVRLDRISFTTGLSVTGNPLGALLIGHLRAGRLSCRSDGSERQVRPGDVYLLAQPDHPYAATIDNTDDELTILDAALLSQVASTAADLARQRVRFTGYEPISPQAAQMWKDTCAYVRHTVLGNPQAAGHPLLAASAARLLAAVALATFPNNALTEPDIADRHDAHPAALQRAMTFIEEHAQQDISAADIAAAAFVSIRAVQLAFRRHLDTTPMAYLRRVRLDHAHRDLLAADPARTTIAAIAYRWGFPSASRFTTSYRTVYRVPPSHTLRRQ